MRRVRSSSIQAIGYGEDAEELWVEYHSAPGTYGYKSVPRDVFVALAEAGSKGSYVNRVIEGRFPVSSTRAARPASARGPSSGIDVARASQAVAGPASRRRFKQQHGRECPISL